MSDTRSALEAALAADPDDVALHAAYADYLIEAGDPRGEYIRLCLGLEDPALTPAARAAVRQRQYDLFRAHSRAWVGPLAGHPARLSGHWWRGWVRSVRATRFTPGLFTLLAVAPITRLLRSADFSDAPVGDAGVDELVASGLVARLRGLDLCRCAITDEGAGALARCPDVPRLESLYLAGNLLSPIGVDALARAGVAVRGPQRFAGLPDDPVQD